MAGERLCTYPIGIIENRQRAAEQKLGESAAIENFRMEGKAIGFYLSKVYDLSHLQEVPPFTLATGYFKVEKIELKKEDRIEIYCRPDIIPEHFESKPFSSGLLEGILAAITKKYVNCEYKGSVQVGSETYEKFELTFGYPMGNLKSVDGNFDPKRFGVKENTFSILYANEREKFKQILKELSKPYEAMLITHLHPKPIIEKYTNKFSQVIWLKDKESKEQSLENILEIPTGRIDHELTRIPIDFIIRCVTSEEKPALIITGLEPFKGIKDYEAKVPMWLSKLNNTIMEYGGIGLLALDENSFDKSFVSTVRNILGEGII